MTIRRIMIASDLSERSDRALRRGLSLAAGVNAEVTLVTIVDEAFPVEIADDLLAKCRNHLAAAAARFGGHPARSGWRSATRRGGLSR